MVKEQDVYPLDTVVRIKRTGQFAVVKHRQFLLNGRNFLHYLAQIEGRGNGLYAIYHEDVELECLPQNNFNVPQGVE